MQTLLPFNTNIPKIPPSELGFVCNSEMPPHINILFRARPPLQYLPFKHHDIKRKYTGVFPTTENILSYFEKKAPSPNQKSDSKYIEKLKNLVIRLDQQKEKNKTLISEWNPKANPNATSDPYKTLFVYKLDPKIDEKRLKREFETYGEIKKVRIIRDLNGNNRGYAFIEYVHKSSFTAAKNARTKKIGSNYVHIDIERGRVEKNWKPRRFGGGEGKTRAMPRWLKKELDEIRKRFPGLTEEKGEIVSEEGEEGSIVEMNNNTNKESNRNKEESSDRKRRKNRSDSNETIKEDNYYRRKRKRSRSRHNNGSYSRSRSPSYSHHSRSEMMKKKYKREYEMGEII